MPLKVSDGIGAWIKDFQKSDAPQFKGKSKDERRDQAVAAYLSAKRGDQKEGYMPNYADKMKKKMITPSDKDKLLKIRQMLDKEKKPGKKESVVRSADKRPEVFTKPDGKRGVRMVPVDKQVVKTEAMSPAEKAAHDKARADFFKKGGKVTKLPPGKASGWHGKDDLGSGMKGMLAKGSAKKLGLKKHGKHLDTSTPVHKESMLGHSDAAKLNGGKSKDSNFNSPESHIDYHHRRSDGHKKSGGDQDRHRYQVAKKLGYNMNEDFMFKVGVEGLPDMIIGGSSPGEVKARLRKIVKQPSMISSVDRMTSAEVKKRYRDMAQGKEDANESVLEKHVYRFSTKTKQGNIHHSSKDETGAKKAIEKRTGEKVQSMTYRGPVSSMPKGRVREMVDPMDLRGRPKKRDPYPNSPYGMKHPLHPLNIKKNKILNRRKKSVAAKNESYEGLNEAPGIVTKNVAAAKADIQKATRALNNAAGKSERPLTRSIMNAIKALKTASKELQ